MSFDKVDLRVCGDVDRHSLKCATFGNLLLNGVL
jgi:hypothetical protein